MNSFIGLSILFLSSCLAASIKNNDGLVIPLHNRVSYIGVLVKVGQPSQNIELLLDSGSSVSWVVSEDNPFCKLESKNQLPSLDCNRYGTFNSNNSEVFTTKNESFHLEYYDNTTVDGIFGYDKIEISNMRDSDLFKLDEFEIGIGKSTNSDIGILGLGIPHFKKPTTIKKINEINDYKPVVYDRRNIITDFKKASIIDRSLFGIWLDDRSDNGELTIGSIDEAKFHPPLISTRFINYENPNHPVKNFEVGISAIYLTVNNSIKTKSEYGDDDDNEDIVVNAYDLFKETTFEDRYIPALLDTGSSYTHIPIEIYNSLVKSLQDSYDIYGTLNGYPLVPCFNEEEDDNSLYGGYKMGENLLSFKFNHATLNIPLKSFLKRSPSDSTRLLRSNQRPELCILGIEPQFKNSTIIGQAFFRSVYSIFDLDKMELLMAPSIYTNKRSLRKITLNDDLDAIDDGVIEDDLMQSLYNPKTDFVMDTRDGYYKLVSKSSAQRVETISMFLWWIYLVIVTIL